MHPPSIFRVKNLSGYRAAQPSLKAYEQIFGFVAPALPNLTNPVNPNPVAIKRAAFWEDRGLHQWTKRASAEALKVAGMGLQNLLKDNTAAAEKNFIEALRLESNVKIFHFFLGETYRLQGKAKLALDFLEHSATANSGFRGPEVGAALVYWHTKDYARSERKFARACINNQTKPTPWFLRGVMKAEAGKLEESLSHLATAQACGGVDPEIGRCYSKVRQALLSGVSHSVHCGVDPMKVPICICI